jgi:thiaminase
MYEVPAMERKGFTSELWRSITSIYDGILAHPFLRGLTDGTLTEERFRFYVLQDTFSLCKESALSGKAPVISALPSG